tara:strand:+ start:3115 stop:3411 length:297 start_codon:yes stop_codon:yes gene_type:complete
MKKGPLSKTEKTYIEDNSESEVTDLAEHLDRSESVVSRHLEVVKNDKEIPDSSNLYARDKNKVATIMTEAASAAGDESRKRPSMPKKYKGIIHKIKED